MLAVGVTFIFGTRHHSIYYLLILGLDKILISYLKLAYHDPRPYMVASWIKPFKCSKGFGNPSGHSSASSLWAITLFLDIFHGAKIGNSIERFFSRWFYFLSFCFCAYWAITIPYTRFLLGVHSLDQIIFGSMLGIWGSLFMHFLVRDNLLKHLYQFSK